MKAIKELYEYFYPLIVQYIGRQFSDAVDGRDIQFFVKLFGIKLYNNCVPNAWYTRKIRFVESGSKSIWIRVPSGITSNTKNGQYRKRTAFSRI